MATSRYHDFEDVKCSCMSKGRRLTMIYVAIGVAAVLLVLVVFAAVQVDDWRRDLTTNVAATGDNASDERLRPIETALAPAELAGIVKQAMQPPGNWQLREESQEPGGIELHFVRTTPVLRFKDDIRVRIELRNDGSKLTAESRSRIGKGDLGQNPRNLRELLGAVRAQLP